MKFTLEIKCNNAAFYADDPEDESPTPGPELARILRTLAKRLDVDEPSPLPDGGNLLDANGNSVGFWHLTDPF